ncbi:PQQ-like beta-propeller repeat protein [candidate division WOR-3 bacterium]|nr:PQQ-like beta-propeller repeat protein [candidate division WOR-3 bacterium]
MKDQTRLIAAGILAAIITGLSCQRNRAPEVPAIPSGPTLCHRDSTCVFTTTASDPDGDSVLVRFQWTEAWTSNWLGRFASGATVAVTHVWYDTGTFSVRAEAKDVGERGSGWSDPLIVRVVRRRPPSKPGAPTGPTVGRQDSTYTFTAAAFHPDSIKVAVRFAWGDGDTSEWGAFRPSGDSTRMSHAWAAPGICSVRVQVKDSNELKTDWSAPSRIEVLPPDTLYRWRIRLDTTNAQNSSPAIGPDGTIYVGSSDSSLCAVNPDGSFKWRYPVAGAVMSSPAVGTDGTVYFGCDDSRLYALSPDGSLKWRHAVGGACRSSPAIAADGTIYVGSNSRYLYAVNPNGTHRWAFLTGGAIRSSPAVAADGTIYFGSLDNCLHAINPDGSAAWCCTTGAGIHSSPAIGPDGTVYFGSDDKHLYAVNPDSTPRWNYLAGERVRSSPVVAPDGSIYFGSDDRRLYALYSDGTPKWSFVTGGNLNDAPAVASDGTVYFGSDDGWLYALNPDGSLRWRYRAGGAVESSPAIGSDGTVYFTSNDGYLYALKSAGTLADSSWPKFHRDAANTGRAGGRR